MNPLQKAISSSTGSVVSFGGGKTVLRANAATVRGVLDPMMELAGWWLREAGSCRTPVSLPGVAELWRVEGYGCSIPGNLDGCSLAPGEPFPVTPWRQFR